MSAAPIGVGLSLRDYGIGIRRQLRPAVALYFKSLGHEDWFYYYLSGMIFLSLIIYATMARPPSTNSAMHRHQ